MAIYTKDPEAKLDYGFNWENWLANGESIISSIWTVPEGLTKITDSFTGILTTIWLLGGIVGINYDVVNHIITSQGREDDRTIRIKVRQR